MSLAENILFTGVGVVIFVALLIIWIVFRKKTKLALSLSGILLILYLGYYIYLMQTTTNQQGMQEKQNVSSIQQEHMIIGR